VVWFQVAVDVEADSVSAYALPISTLQLLRVCSFTDYGILNHSGTNDGLEAPDTISECTTK
jgi:hypothetical protein